MAENCLLTENDRSKSWFVLVRHLCDKYFLPSPVLLLSLQLSKEKYKAIVKSKVVSFWESKLRADAASKPSLRFFNPNFSSLLKPHPILTTPKSNPYEVNKCVVQLRMLSGRYRDDYLLRHFHQDNIHGACTLCSSIPGDLVHYLCFCQELNDQRQKLFHWWLISTDGNSILHSLIHKKKNSSSTDFVRFVLDPSSDSDVIVLIQQNLLDLETIFKLTRTYCFSIHKSRMKMIGKV